MYNDEHFEYERIQNRTLRIEKLKLISNINTDDIPDLYITKNITPPTCSSIKNIPKITYSKEYGDNITYIPEQCPICLDAIWRDTSVVCCFYCDKIICLTCYKNINNDASSNNKELLCPLCRGLLIDYSTERNIGESNIRESSIRESNIRESNIRESNRRISNYNRIVPMNDVEAGQEAILEQEMRIRNENENDCYNFKVALEIVIFVVLVLIGFVILSTM
tara:strand:- start:6239 stop:6901 length:663 start_codon:yes stop_codon:yes gene_type:complete